jgi:hypothetical protein
MSRRELPRLYEPHPEHNGTNRVAELPMACVEPAKDGWSAAAMDVM